MKIRRDILQVVADTHVGSTIGLAHPGIILDDGIAIGLGKHQQWLWEHWCEYWQWANSFKPRNGGKIYTVINGDASDRPNHESTAFITHNEAIIRRAAVEILQPLRDHSDYLFLVRGTQAHTGPESSDEESIAELLHTERNPNTRTYSWWILPLIIGGVEFKFSHHCSMGTRGWTYANAANLIATETIFEYAQYHQQPPDWVIRSHAHRFSDSGYNFSTHAIVTPAWQLATPYAHKSFTDKLSHIGGVVFVIENGTAQMFIKRFLPDRQEPWSSENMVFVPRSGEMEGK